MGTLPDLIVDLTKESLSERVMDDKWWGAYRFFECSGAQSRVNFSVSPGFLAVPGKTQNLCQ